MKILKLARFSYYISVTSRTNNVTHVITDLFKVIVKSAVDSFIMYLIHLFVQQQFSGLFKEITSQQID